MNCNFEGSNCNFESEKNKYQKIERTRIPEVSALSSGKNHVKVSISVLTRAELIPAMPLSRIRRRVTDMVTLHFLFFCWYVLKALLLLAFHYIIVD